MFDSYIFQSSGGAIFAMTLVFYLVCLEIGFHYGKWFKNSKMAGFRTQIVTIQTSVLGLLALILGFTFSMSIDRFETRKHLVVEEANAIGTSYLRAELFKEPYRSDMQALLKKYLDNRLVLVHLSLNIHSIDQSLQESENLQKEIWAKAVEISDHDDRLPIVSLLLQSLNQMIDLHADRLHSVTNRLPDAILYLIFFIAGLSLALTGYISGIDGARSILTMAILAVLFAAVTLVIIDLDRPNRGFINEHYTSFTNLRSSIDRL